MQWCASLVTLRKMNWPVSNKDQPKKLWSYLTKAGYNGLQSSGPSLSFFPIGH